MSPRTKAILISLLGNSFEWYDFMVYAALAPILAQVFFPEADAVTALLATYGTFAAGFLTRPFGALLFGYLGDHHGRRYALLMAISLMSLPTLLIGCLPTYATAGIAAPILLIFLRLLQGLAMSGEMPGCITFLSEMAPLHLRSMIASLAVVAALSGLLMATNSVWWLNNHFGETALRDGLWRIPFWLAGALGLIIYGLRRNLAESTAFLKQKHSNACPVRTCLKHYKRQIVQGIGCYAANGIGFYFLMAFSLSYFYHLCHLSLHTAFYLTIFLQVSMLVTLPLGGRLADRYGARKVGIISLLLMLGGTYSAVVFLSQLTEHHTGFTLLGLFLIAAVFAIYSAILPSTSTSLFPTEVRYSGVALLNNIAVTLFGGLSPLLISYLISHYHSLTMPAWPMLICMLISLLSFWSLKEPEKYS